MLKRLVLSLSIAFTCIFSQAQAPDPAQNLEALLFYLEHYYVDSLGRQQIVEEAIKSVLKELDPHSYYLSAKELKESDEALSGNFEGIGIQFNIFQDTILVVSPISGGPSEKVGLRSGDKIIYVNDTLVAGQKITNNDVFKYLRGAKGTKVRVKILRKGDAGLQEYTIERDKIPIFSVDASYLITPETGYIKINRFASTTAEEFRTGIIDLKSKGAKNLILDLSDNSGGYLNAAVSLADEFLKNNELIVYTEGIHSPRTDYKSTVRGNFEDGRLIVIINEGSASASEIVSGAVQDLDRGIVVGRRSFGKGLVQNTFPLNDGSAIRLTTARYYTPSGRFIQAPFEEGVEKYFENLYSRFENGELTDPENIHFPDSLKFYTRNKRVVYGGGGIMPDIFIPLDTSFYTTYLTDLNRKNSFFDFSIEYIEKNRENLKTSYPDYETFNKHFHVDDYILTEFIEYGATKGVEKSADQLSVSQDFIKMRIKAGIANNLYGRDSFFKVYNQYDKTIQKALELIESTSFEQKLGK